MVIEKYVLVGDDSHIYGTVTDESVACHWATLLNADVEIIKEEPSIFDNLIENSLVL